MSAQNRHGRPVCCEWCGRLLTSGNRVDLVVPDSRFLHPETSDRDGQRPTHACSRGHAERLIERGRRRWVDEELWARKFSRVRVRWSPGASLDDVARRTGLTITQLLRMADWRLRHMSSRQ